MATDTAVKMWSRSTGGMSSEDLLERHASFREGYTVTHAPNETRGAIINAAGLPVIGSVHENNPWVFCKNVEIANSGLVMSTLIATYEGEIGPGSSPSGSPLDDLPKYEFSSVESTEPIDEDTDGNPIATKNKEPIEGVTREVYDVLLTVDRNYLDVNIPATKAYLESVNADAWPPIKPFPAGTGRLKNFRAAPQLLPNGAIKYWRVHAEILFRTPYRTTNARAWWARVRHEGYRVKLDNGAIVNAWEDLQMNANKPILLDQDGKKLPPNMPAHWLEFKRYPNILPYSALGLF